MSKKVSQRIEAFIGFSTLQYVNAMLCHLMTPIRTRERVIYFIFIESAAFAFLADIADESEIEAFVLENMFGEEGTLSNVGACLNEKRIAYGLLAKKDPDAVKVAESSNQAISSFIRGEGEFTKGALATLIRNEELFPTL